MKIKPLWSIGGQLGLRFTIGKCTEWPLLCAVLLEPQFPISKLEIAGLQ